MREPRDLMLVPDEVRKCVVFVAHESSNGHKRCIGTAFFVSRPIVKNELHAVYCVTAKHLLDQIRSRSGYKVLLRVNLVGKGAEWVETSLTDWQMHPVDGNADVAVLPFPLTDAHDHLEAVPFVVEI
jgi:hypothetical protein